MLFGGQGEIAQLDLIFKMVGTPSEETWPGHKKLKAFERVRAPAPLPPSPAQYVVITIVAVHNGSALTHALMACRACMPQPLHARVDDACAA